MPSTMVAVPPIWLSVLLNDDMPGIIPVTVCTIERQPSPWHPCFASCATSAVKSTWLTGPVLCVATAADHRHSFADGRCGVGLTAPTTLDASCAVSNAHGSMLGWFPVAGTVLGVALGDGLVGELGAGPLVAAAALPPAMATESTTAS